MSFIPVIKGTSIQGLQPTILILTQRISQSISTVDSRHPANLFVDCYFDITLKKHSIMITKPWDGLSLDDNTVIVRYEQV